MNRLNLLSHLFANSPRWRRVAVWSAIFSTAAGATALAQPAPSTMSGPPGSQQPEQVFAEAAASSNAFIMQQPPSGSVADLGNYSRDIGIGGTGAMARMGHIAGETVGRKQSITHFEVMPYAFVDNTMWFTDGRFYTTNNGHIGGSGGVGMRQFLPNFNSIFGVSGWYDADDTRQKMFTQAGISLEYLSEYFDVRSNLYANTGRKSANLGTSFVKGSEHFVDDNIAFNTQTHRAAGTDGLDLTITVPVPGAFFQTINLEASAGGYHYIANDFNLDDATGYRLRLDGDFLRQTLHAFLDFTSDKVFNNNLVFGADLNYYHDVQRRPRLGHNQFNRMSEWVRRNYNVVAIDQTIVNPDELAINPLTGDPYIVLHVRNIVPADPNFPNFPAPAGDGSVQNPYQFVDEAQADPRNADIVFVHAGSVFTNMPVVLEANQQILGEGVDHPIQVANAISNGGTILLPTVTVPPNDPILPVLRDTLGTAVTLADNSTFAGFQIENTTGTAILGDGINGSEIRDVSIEGTNGAGSHGLHLVDTTGTIRVEQVTTSGVEGTDLFIDGGSSTVNWFGGLLENTAGRAVVIQNQTGGTINLAGDNASSPSLGFGGLTITDNGGDGILIQDTNAAVVFGRSADTPTSSAGVSILNSGTTGVAVLNLGQAGSVSFLHGLEIDDPAGVPLLIQNSQGDFLLADDTGLTNDLLILGRGVNTAIDLNNIGQLSQVVFLGDTVIGAVPALINDDPAINFHNGSTGSVRFDGDISIGQVARPGESDAGESIVINIGDINGVGINGAGASFAANGNVSIDGSFGGPDIRIGGFVDNTDPNNPIIIADPTNVTFGLPTAPAIITIDPDLGPSLDIEGSSGNIRFNSSLVILDSIGRQITVQNNTGTVGFGSVDIGTTVIAGDSVVNVSRNTGAVSFGSLSIDNVGGVSFFARENTQLSTGGGTIDSFGGQAIDIVNLNPFAPGAIAGPKSLDITFDSVTADSFGPALFGIRVVDNSVISADTGNIITNEDASFRILGSGTRGSGGLISSRVALTDGFLPRGAIFQNINTVELNSQQYDLNEGLAILSINTVDFTLNNALMTENGTGFDPLGRHQILLQVDQDIEDFDTYNYTITNNLMADDVNTSIVTNDALLQIETTTLSNGATLNLSILNNQDATTLIPGFFSNRDLNSGAAVRVDWNGTINASVNQNAFELAAGANNQMGLDIIQNGTTFVNSVQFNRNTLVATGTTDDGLRGVRMDFDGRTDLQILDNAVVNLTTGAITPGFVFAGTNATGFDLRLRSVGNTVVFDDNYLDFNNVGGTGLLFSLINSSSVAIGDDTGTFTNFGNQIDLTDTDATFDRGIIFQTTFGTVDLSGTQNNVIRTIPAVGNGTFIPFQPPGSSTGQILINGVRQP
jgi:hypothetical protein